MSRVSRLGERCHRSRVAALALLAGLIMSAPALAASRLEAITEF